VETVRIVAASVSHPDIRISQEEAAERISSRLASPRHVRAIARGTQIESRATVICAEEIANLGSVEQRNAIYEAQAPKLAAQAARNLQTRFDNMSFLATSSCTGYLVPGLDVHLAQELGLPGNAVRLPLTEAGCSGGLLALARTADYLKSRPARGLVVAAELCSLAFHSSAEDGNLTSAMLFADGAGAALMQSGEEFPAAMEVIDAASVLVPCSFDELGFRLTDHGFRPILSRTLTETLLEPTVEAVQCLLGKHGLTPPAIDFWLVHPGGPRILECMGRALSIQADAIRWSWQTLRESGNTSSAAILEVLYRYLDDPGSPKGWGVLLAFGPGVSIELMLVRR
jgi:alkylresorcinol/alkylpyrone synthase